MIRELNQNNKDGLSRDGMDISLTKINLKTSEIEWAGANNNLWIIKDNNLEEFKADRQAINYTENPLPFSNHKIKTKKGNKLYMFTDGFADQFGGEKGKKFKYKPFKKLLLSISNEPLAKQKDVLNEHFNKWKGNLEQVDDICIIGIEI